MSEMLTYEQTIKECEGKSNIWIMQTSNAIIKEIADHVVASHGSPSVEKLKQYEIMLKAFKDELITRGVL